MPMMDVREMKRGFLSNAGRISVCLINCSASGQLTNTELRLLASGKLNFLFILRLLLRRQARQPAFPRLGRVFLYFLAELKCRPTHIRTLGCLAGFQGFSVLP